MKQNTVASNLSELNPLIWVYSNTFTQRLKAKPISLIKLIEHSILFKLNFTSQNLSSTFSMELNVNKVSRPRQVTFKKLPH